MNLRWEVGIIQPLLKSIGLWPESGATPTILFVANFVMQNFLIATFLPSLFREPSRSKVIDKIFGLTGLALSYCDLCMFRYQWPNVKPMVKYIKENWMQFHQLPENMQITMLIFGKQQKKITTFICSALAVSLIFYSVQPILLHLAFGSKFPLEQPNDPWYPFNATVSPLFEITYVIQCLCFCSSTVIFSSIDCCILWLIFHCCGQLEILRNVVNHYSGKLHHNEKSVDNDESLHKLCNCLNCIVNYHLKICRAISLFDNAFHMIIFARMIICTLHFTCIGYTIMELRDEGNFGFLVIRVLFLITMNSSLFTYCWLGDKLREKSEKIAYTAFSRQMSEQHSLQKDLIMIIRQMQMRPVYITAGKFFILSLELFKEYISKSLSYLSVLAAMRFNTR